MVIITGTIRLASESEFDRVHEALVRRAERSRQDEGNIDYQFSRSIEDGCEIRLIEKWASEAHLNAHLAVPDDEFSRVLGTARIERAVVMAYEADDERVLMQRE